MERSGPMMQTILRVRNKLKFEIKVYCWSGSKHYIPETQNVIILYKQTKTIFTVNFFSKRILYNYRPLHVG